MTGFWGTVRVRLASGRAGSRGNTYERPAGSDRGAVHFEYLLIFLLPVDVPVVHAIARRKSRGAAVTIEIVTITARLADCAAPVPVAVEIPIDARLTELAAIIPVAIEVAVTIATRLADRAVFLHFVSRAHAGCARPVIIAVTGVAALHLVARAELGSARRTARAAVHALRLHQRGRTQQQGCGNYDRSRRPSSPSR